MKKRMKAFYDDERDVDGAGTSECVVNKDFHRFTQSFRPHRLNGLD